QADPNLSQTGPLAVATPGGLAAYSELASRCGNLPLKRLLRPGMIAARDGFRLDSNLAGSIKAHRKVLARYAGSQETFLNADGSAPKAGELLVQPTLAATYRNIAKHGPVWFYEGAFAERVGAWMAKHGGILTAQDFADYRVKLREPVVSTYRGRTVIGFPPPSSGGVHVAQVLNILENFDVKQTFEENPADGICLVADAMKVAFADRAYWLGDSDFVRVPRGLTSKEYARQLSAKVSPDKASEVPSHGDPPRWRQDVFGRHTTHIAAADSEGYWVAITATINTSLGSKVVVPGTGVVLNNMMDDFAIHPGTPNAFGLIGGQFNSIAGGKRPLSSMSPTILLNEEKEPIMALGCAGGPKIITQVLCAIVNTLDRGMSPEQALSQPRYHHQWAPDVLYVQDTMPSDIVDALRMKGHQVEPLSSTGKVQIVSRDSQGKFDAVHDPHIKGKAAVVTAPTAEKALPRRELQEAAP
ncbi:MAG: gamma-glutamyltransferase, partial [Planctomycetales bacterium]|nr:gamma-glutamyltransferase [Planctomycetales bacterium]